jgi:hypothetical protein
MFPSEHTLAPQPEPFLTTRLRRSDAILGQEPILVQSRRISQRVMIPGVGVLTLL